jgi:ERCC4-type nuclease
MIRLIVDSRETQLLSLLQGRCLDKYIGKINIEMQQLEIGDIHIIFDDNTIQRTWIIERKTVQDLMASIKDGRYKEQKMRLLSSGCDVTYVIEGDDVLCSRYERYQNTLSGAYLHTMYRDNIRVIYTKNVNDTCTFLLTLCAKIIDRPEAFIPAQGEAQPTEDYINCVKVKTKKIDNITPENCYLMQLAQIPTISVVIAKKIQEMYPTMKALLVALEQADDKIGMLYKIDKIGKEKAAKILQYMSV